MSAHSATKQPAEAHARTSAADTPAPTSTTSDSTVHDASAVQPSDIPPPATSSDDLPGETATLQTVSKESSQESEAQVLIAQVRSHVEVERMRTQSGGSAISGVRLDSTDVIEHYTDVSFEDDTFGACNCYPLLLFFMHFCRRFFLSCSVPSM